MQHFVAPAQLLFAEFSGQWVAVSMLTFSSTVLAGVALVLVAHCQEHGPVPLDLPRCGCWNFKLCILLVCWELLGSGRGCLRRLLGQLIAAPGNHLHAACSAWSGKWSHKIQ